jgi:hypothetical protein
MNLKLDPGFYRFNFFRFISALGTAAHQQAAGTLMNADNADFIRVF